MHSIEVIPESSGNAGLPPAHWKPPTSSYRGRNVLQKSTEESDDLGEKELLLGNAGRPSQEEKPPALNDRNIAVYEPLDSERKINSCSYETVLKVAGYAWIGFWGVSPTVALSTFAGYCYSHPQDLERLCLKSLSGDDAPSNIMGMWYVTLAILYPAVYSCAVWKMLRRT